MYQIWDGGGRAIDRYTVVFYPSGDYIAMSRLPTHPQGFCQHGSGINVERLNVHKDNKNGTLHCYLGQLIELSDMPEECQRIVEEEDKLYEAVEESKNRLYLSDVDSIIVDR